MSESFHGQAGTETRESIDVTFDKDTFLTLARRYKWTSRWLALQLGLLLLTATVPYLYPNGHEMAGVAFGIGLALTLFVAVAGVALAVANAARRLRSRLLHSDVAT